jgi:hypothetical protein
MILYSNYSLTYMNSNVHRARVRAHNPCSSDVLNNSIPHSPITLKMNVIFGKTLQTLARDRKRPLRLGRGRLMMMMMMMMMIFVHLLGRTQRALFRTLRHVHEVPGSNIGRKAGYHDVIFMRQNLGNAHDFLFHIPSISTFLMRRQDRSVV